MEGLRPDLRVFAKTAGAGCIPGDVSEWPQLKPYLAESIAYIEELEAERDRLRDELESRTSEILITQTGVALACSGPVKGVFDQLCAENDELRQEIADRADSEKRTTEMLVEVLRDLERAQAKIEGLERELYVC